jgi:ribosomal protein S18 acetylase RimI-like enzyme
MNNDSPHCNIHDICIERMAKTEHDFLFSLEIRNAAMRPHLIKRWEWNAKWQEELHRRRFKAYPFNAIRFQGQRVGTFCLTVLPTHSFLSEFYIHPQFQNLGIGTKVLDRICMAADKNDVSLRLTVLTWNPAVGLYNRFRFHEISRDELHCVMERSPANFNRQAQHYRR